MDGFGIPFLDSSWYSVHEHDSLHEGEGYSSGEVANEDVWVFNIGSSNMILEFQDILVQRRGVGSVFLKDHLLGSKPGNGSSSDISLFKVFIELGDKVCVDS